MFFTGFFVAEKILSSQELQEIDLRTEKSSQSELLECEGLLKQLYELALSKLDKRLLRGSMDVSIWTKKVQEIVYLSDTLRELGKLYG